jgi:ubiquinone/menaquinone biosynthesis C-methylase UbiE
MPDNFEEKAKNWDNNPLIVEISNIFFEEIRKNVKITKDLKILELGCGTGLVGLNFSSLVNSILMIDNSKAMLSVLQTKILKNKLKNIEVLEGDINNLEIEKSKFDLIISFMTFHHVKNIPNIVNIFKNILKRNGSVIIGDLCKEDGSFHGLEKVEHNGFEMEEIKNIFSKNDLYVNKIYEYNVLKKPDIDGNLRDYDQFILVAQKNS